MFASFVCLVELYYWLEHIVLNTSFLFKLSVSCVCP